MCVWSTERTVLLTEPTLWTSANALLYFALPTAGGAEGRNRSAEGKTKGVTSARWTLMPLAKVVGVGRHWPTLGTAGPEYLIFGLEPSLARKAMMAIAGAETTARPLAFFTPSGIGAKLAARFASKAACCAGT